jgi:hypothetical protein
MCRLQRSDNAKSGQSLDGFSRDHFKMFDSVSSVGLWTVCLHRMFEGIQSVIDRSITNGMNGDLEVEGVGKIDNGEELGRGPNWSGGRAICIRLGKECSASERQPCSLDRCSRLNSRIHNAVTEDLDPHNLEPRFHRLQSMLMPFSCPDPVQPISLSPIWRDKPMTSQSNW